MFNDPFYARIQNCETVIYQLEYQSVQLKNIETIFNRHRYEIVSVIIFIGIYAMHTRVTLRMALIYSGKCCSIAAMHRFTVHAISHPI